ncbi:hypothetical protein Sinac_7644 (plasmid) [Singulisphaera acidiphila DSM 18658]|uniref:Secreted protein n=1 Tax=Singulisphaera acidiphila (strain ATCC BAA-1392 / DSM 18658 / VKM B-2454 / MOB10) TaxID=886293 RepID=L0DQG0_SINAD|nr:hypothetical protein Sinac_7644 [Singulisphaera acidiphila DSM 18658]
MRMMISIVGVGLLSAIAALSLGSSPPEGPKGTCPCGENCQCGPDCPCRHGGLCDDSRCPCHPSDVSHDHGKHEHDESPVARTCREKSCQDYGRTVALDHIHRKSLFLYVDPLDDPCRTPPKLYPILPVGPR